MADLRLAELIAPLSQIVGLGTGHPPETAVRTCLLATGLARQMNLPEREVADVYYTTLLQHVGCTAYAHETAALVGNEIAFFAAAALIDDTNPRESIRFLLTGLARTSPPPARIRAIVNTLRAGPDEAQRFFRANCEVAVRIVTRIGLPDAVQAGIGASATRWDGSGYPPGVKGDDIPSPARFAPVAQQAILCHDVDGSDLALATVRRRSGSWLDPDIADAFARHGRALLAEIDSGDPAVAVIDAEPRPHRLIPDARVNEIARAFADVTDLKSPWLHGHSTGVARLAKGAARACGLLEPEVSRIERAGYLHDLGRIGVSSGIWDKPGPLTSIEWEQVRLHPYHSERILSRVPALADLAPIAGMHHERLDGSGYHRQATATTIPMDARILAVADVWDAMTHDRPHRAARPVGAAADELRVDVERGKLDGEAVHAVLEAAGLEAGPARRAWPAGLTDREVDVLRLATRGLSNREIGATLFISPKTAGHHIQHIYDKIGVSTRAGAALFAMEHDLLRA